MRYLGGGVLGGGVAVTGTSTGTMTQDYDNAPITTLKFYLLNFKFQVVLIYLLTNLLTTLTII